MSTTVTAAGSAGLGGRFLLCRRGGFRGLLLYPPQAAALRLPVLRRRAAAPEWYRGSVLAWFSPICRRACGKVKIQIRRSAQLHRKIAGDRACRRIGGQRRQWQPECCRTPAKALSRSGWRRSVRRFPTQCPVRLFASAHRQMHARSCCSAGSSCSRFALFHGQQHAQQRHPVMRGIGRGKLPARTARPPHPAAASAPDPESRPRADRPRAERRQACPAHSAAETAAPHPAPPGASCSSAQRLRMVGSSCSALVDRIRNTP